MKILKAKIKKTSTHYLKGLNQKEKPIWLSITGFNVMGDHNYRIKAIKGFRNGFAEYQEIWVSGSEIELKQHEENQLSLDIFSKEEEEENKHNPRYFNQRRFEVSTITEKMYIHAPDLKTAEKVAGEYGLTKYSIKQVARLNRNELKE
jgi:hypothetical protein